jgi:hypothetical protein
VAARLEPVTGVPKINPAQIAYIEELRYKLETRPNDS